MRNFLTILIFAAIAFTFSACGGAKLSVADEQLARGEYYDASRTYRKVYNKLTKREERQQRGVVAYRMAECHRMLNQHARAAAAYQNAIRYEYPDSTAKLRLAQMLHAQGRYPQAITAYQEFLDLNPASVEAQNGLLGAKIAADSKKRSSRYIVKQDRLFNSRRADYAPMYLDRNSLDQIYFTTTNEKTTGNNRSEITGMKNGDIWFSKKNERGEWMKPEPVEGELNSDLDEGIVSFTPDGQTMYLSKARREPNSSTGVEIYTSQRSDAKWSAPVKYEITSDTISSYGHPAVSPDGVYLYFTSDMPGGQGGKDLWRVNLKERGGSLENLGDQINTPGDEVFPYVYSDSILYFSSNGHPGLGALDIFKAQLTPAGDWVVSNLGSPMNSSADDFGITFGKGESGFLSSNRGDARGYDHIYSFVLPDLKITISGWVLDKDEYPIPNAVIRIVGDDGSNQKEVARDDGSFKFNLNRGVSYVMLAGAKGFLNGKQQFTASDAEEDADYYIDFLLSSLNKPNIIDNIFYDYDKATLRPESKEALDQMVQIMNDNPNITIEMASHTDRHGTEAYNMDLSMRRAKAVIDYLIEAGISPDRLQFQGYGKSRPMTITKKLNRLHPQFNEGDVLDERYVEQLSPEDQDAADQINRRTEFQVLSVDYHMF